jgi:hypothetical protein
MTRIALPLTLLTATLALALPAQAAGLTRTYVSQAGSDSNPCTSTQPCRHFANAYAGTAANGIITALDPGGYGPITVTTALTINGLGWASITAPSGGDGIIINAGVNDQVTLIGLTVDGAGAGAHGIVFNSGASLTITNCVAQNFVFANAALTGTGILIQPTSGTVKFGITNTTVTNNSVHGIVYEPASGSPNVTGVIDHTVVTNGGGDGVEAVTTNTAGGATAIAISNSMLTANAHDGLTVSVGTGTLAVSIDNVSVSGSGNVGIAAANTAKVLLRRSVVTGNTTGVANGTSPNTFYTLKDNTISLNTTDFFNGVGLNTTLNQQ